MQAHGNWLKLRRYLTFTVLQLGVISGSGPSSLPAQIGYGYKKGRDPLILSIKRIVLGSRQGRWSSVQREYRKLGWQFQELAEDLDVDLSGSFLKALEGRSMNALSVEISRLLYHTVMQKLYWNEKEKLREFIKAKSRTDAALYYYEEILSIGVRNFDRKRKRNHHRRILDAFAALRRSVGSAGLFGFQARPPDLGQFKAKRIVILNLLKDVYPHVILAPDPRKIQR